MLHRVVATLPLYCTPAPAIRQERGRNETPLHLRSVACTVWGRLYNGIRSFYKRGAVMKITELRTYVTWGEPRNWVFVKVITDSGLYGWGEATLERREGTVRACVEEMGQSLIDKDPLAVEHHWQALFRHSFWRGGVVYNSALAALDQALWDIRGKAWGVPVYRLLGGPTRERIRLYTHVGIYNPNLLEEDARRDIADGFTAVKTGAWAGDAALPEAEMIAAFAERVGRLRAVVGPSVDIMIDNHGRSRASVAVRLMEALTPHNLLWLEEPRVRGRSGRTRPRTRGRAEDGYCHR